MLRIYIFQGKFYTYFQHISTFPAMKLSYNLHTVHVQQAPHRNIHRHIFPALFDGDISDLEAILFFLPARMGGLGIHDPFELCVVNFLPGQGYCYIWCS